MRPAQALCCALFSLSLLLSPAAADEHAGFSPFVSAEGAIALPPDFRKELVHLGSWFVPEGEASGFHDVYASKSAVEGYRASGRFPDGAVLVKELRPAVVGDYTTGQGVQRASDEVKQWFVMIKDREGRFEENPLWGEGWGWALFQPADPSRNVATSYQVDCLGCHLPARERDFVYDEAYPTLRREAAGR